jgi:hypothetical protein
VLFDAPNTEVINGHCEGFLNCILMGANNAPGSPSGSIGASSQKVSAVAGGPACPSMATCNVVHISNNYQKNSDYVIQNIRRNQFSNNIKDDVNGVSVGNATAGNDPFTALYSWASGVNNTPPTTITNMLTTDPSTPNQFGGGVKAATYGTVSNCASASGSCGSATAGRVAIAPAASTVTVSTTAVTANSEIKVQYDEQLSGVGTCTTATSSEGAAYWVSARSPGVSFTIKTNVAPTGTALACLSFVVIN